MLHYVFPLFKSSNSTLVDSLYLICKLLLFIQEKRRFRELSTPKRKPSKEKRDKLGVRSAPNEYGSKSRKKKKTKYEGQITSASKPKPRYGWVTEDQRDSFNSRFETSGWRGSATSNYKITHHAAASSHSARKSHKLNFSNSSSNGSAKFPQHRYFGSRYSNNSNGGFGRNLDFH